MESITRKGLGGFGPDSPDGDDGGDEDFSSPSAPEIPTMLQRNTNVTCENSNHPEFRLVFNRFHLCFSPSATPGPPSRDWRANIVSGSSSSRSSSQQPVRSAQSALPIRRQRRRQRSSLSPGPAPTAPAPPDRKRKQPGCQDARHEQHGIPGSSASLTHQRQYLGSATAASPSTSTPAHV